MAGKGYHSREMLKAIDDVPWKTHIGEPKRDGFLRCHGDAAARRAVVNNHVRLLPVPPLPGLFRQAATTA